MKHLAHLPNQNGFRFIGITHAGARIECEVRREIIRQGKVHYTVESATGTANYHELAGWEEAPHVCRCCGEETDTGEDCCSDEFPEPGEMRETGR